MPNYVSHNNVIASLRILTPTLDSKPECQDPFQWMAGGCYYHSGKERATWAEARFACGRMGADLAHPTDNWSLKDYTRQISSSGKWDCSPHVEVEEGARATECSCNSN